MNSKPIKPRDFDFNKVSFSAPRAMGTTGAKMLFINYDKGPFTLQLPEMSVGWDIKFYDDPQNSKTGKYAVTLKFSDMENKKQQELHSFLAKLDELLIKTCQENSAAWIKKPKIDENGVRLLYTSLIKRSMGEDGEPNNKYPDDFRIKLNKRDGEYLFKLYDENTIEINLNELDTPLEELIKQNSKLRGVVRCNGVWIGSGKFGCTWRGEQIKVETPKQVAEYAFEDTESDDEKEVDKKDNVLSDSESDSDSTDSE